MLPLNLDAVSLGKRHHQLNQKVKETAVSNFNFDEIKNLPEETDIDRLFKIDLASEIKDVNYIIETLKSGDELYISRGLKCLWLFDDKMADVINCNFLHNNVFPFMSEKMIKKTLTAISMNLKNDVRTYDFYMYCLSNKRIVLAKKFLIRTSEDFKLTTINEKEQILNSNHKIYTYVIGNSFVLAEAYLKKYVAFGTKVLYDLRYLYAISDEKYLSLLEQYTPHWHDREFGLRTSKDIILKHKDRILKSPSLYINLLQLRIMLKYLNSNDIKLIISSLFPEKVEQFWSYNCYNRVREFLNVLPFEERFSFLRNVYQNKYPLVEFEMRDEFYFQRIYILMSESQKEAWALKQLESTNEIFGSNGDYNWYQFINFTQSFEEIKKWLYKTTDKDQRLKMLKIIIRVAKTPKDIKTLLTYLYEKHINEQTIVSIVLEIITAHNVFEFDDACWDVFSEFLYHIGVYYPVGGYGIEKLRVITLLYHILHNKPLPADLFEAYIFGNINILRNVTYFHQALDMLCETKREMIFTTLSQTLIDRLRQHDVENFNVQVLYEHIILFKYLNCIFKKDEYPDLIVKFAERNEKCYSLIFPKPHKTIDKLLTETELLQLLNKDVSLLNAKISDVIKQSSDHIRFRINRFLKKLKVYFFKDVAKLWFKNFMENLYNTPKMSPYAINMIVFSVFQLASQTEKEEFILKYAPENPKIEHRKIDWQLLKIQEAICQFLMYSRPPLPLKFVHLYLKGDYVHYCCPMFGFFAVHLPYYECTKFIESLFNAPISIQKHGVRLVFNIPSFNKQKQIIEKTWMKTKNISLRCILFLSVYDYICNENDEIKQKEIFEFLKVMMKNLNENDDENIFKRVFGRPKILRKRRFLKYKKPKDHTFPTNLRGELFECFYAVLQKMPDKIQFRGYKEDILSRIKTEIKYMRQTFIEDLVERFVNESLDKEIDDCMQIDYFFVKWQLINEYFIANRNEISFEKRLAVLKNIINHCFSMWDHVSNNIYDRRKFFMRFLNELLDYALGKMFCDDYIKPIPLLELLLKEISSNLPIHGICFTLWQLKLTILTINSVSALKENELTEEISISKTFARIFSEGLSILLNHFIEEKLYFPSMLNNIVDLILKCLRSFPYNGIYGSLVLTLICSTLLNIKSIPSCLIVISLLPLDTSEEYLEEYKYVHEKLKLSNDFEVKCQYYKKFCSDNIIRKYV